MSQVKVHSERTYFFKVLWFGFFGSTLVFPGLSYFVNQNASGDPSFDNLPTIKIALILFALIGSTLAVLIKLEKLPLSKITPPKPGESWGQKEQNTFLAKLFARFLICWVISDFIAILGFVISFLGQSFNHGIYLFIIAIASMIIHFPTLPDWVIVTSEVEEPNNP